MSNVNDGGLVTVPRSTLEQLHTELSKPDVPHDMLIAGTLIVLERILGIEQTIDFNDDLMSATALAEDKKRGFGL